MIIINAKKANLNHFHTCLIIFLASDDLEAGLTQNGLTVTLVDGLVEKEKAGLVLII
jgi:hypothetical protein